MSNADTRWDSAPTSNEVTRADDIASVVGRALSVLRVHGARAPAAHRSHWALDPTTAPGIGDLQKQLEQLRYQAQDLVDELVRVVEALAAANTSPGPARPTAPAAPAAPAFETESLPDLAQLRRVAAVAGQATSTRFSLVNDTRDPVEVLLKATSLIGPKGFEIPSRYIGFAPNPLLLGASATQPVEVTIRMPEQIPPGEYSGLVQGVGLQGANARLTVEVRPAAGAG